MIIRTISDIISDRPLNAIAPQDTLRTACQALKAADVGALAVLSDGVLVGILSERDVIRRGVCENRPMDGTSVADVMTPDPRTISESESLASAMEAMLSGGFRHLPVLRDSVVQGMLSMRDIPTDYRLMYERFVEARKGPQPLEGHMAPAD